MSHFKKTHAAWNQKMFANTFGFGEKISQNKCAWNLFGVETTLSTPQRKLRKKIFWYEETKKKNITTNKRCRHSRQYHPLRRSDPPAFFFCTVPNSVAWGGPGAETYKCMHCNKTWIIQTTHGCDQRKTLFIFMLHQYSFIMKHNKPPPHMPCDHADNSDCDRGHIVLFMENQIFLYEKHNANRLLTRRADHTDNSRLWPGPPLIVFYAKSYFLIKHTENRLLTCRADHTDTSRLRSGSLVFFKCKISFLFCNTTQIALS